MPSTAVVILNYNGKNHLEEFLPSVVQHSNESEVFVVDNGSTDESSAFIKDHFPTVELIQLPKNLGYAGGYNEALARIDTDYYVLLNSDVEVSNNWLPPLLNLLESNSQISAVQPKILDYKSKGYFEYAGAAGGYIDWLGYPFCRGRIFDTLESDEGQYVDTREVFWASGACLFIRAKDFHEIGGLDASFFAHMEEIDLCWRLKNAKKQIYYCNDSTVYHLGGGTLSKTNPRKTFLNFRNGLEMILKNVRGRNLLFILPLRAGLDTLAFLRFLLSRQPRNAWSILKAYASILTRSFATLRKRRNLSSPYHLTGVLKKSLVIQYYLWGKKKFSALKIRT